jgi:hypothetical protein
MNIDWSLAPKDATELVRVALCGQKWRKPETKQYWDMNKDFAGYYSPDSLVDKADVLATRPTESKKTVADAWEALKGSSPFVEGDKDDKYIYYYKANGFVTHNTKFPDDINSHFVCTREEFEAYGREQDGEKWTHIDTYGIKVSFLVSEPDSDGGIPVLCDDGYYRLYDFDELKPIKPTLTKAQAWFTLTGLR